jgi:hypothetical protein
MEQIFNSTLRFDNARVEETLSPSGQSGDWTPQPEVVKFDRPFGAPIPGKPKDVAQAISVILTSRSPGGVPVVSVVENVVATKFAFRVRNVDTVGGSCGFYAAAFIESSGNPDSNSVQELWLDHGSEKHVESYFKDASLSGTPYPIAPGGQSGHHAHPHATNSNSSCAPSPAPPSVRSASCPTRAFTSHAFTAASPRPAINAQTLHRTPLGGGAGLYV